MTQDPYERSVLSIFRNLLATAGTLLINTFTLPMVEFFGNNASAWTKTFFVLGIVSIIAFLFTFFGTKERVHQNETEEEKKENVPFLVGLKALFKNKYWIMMTLMLALFFLMYSVNGGATVYYAKDILGDKNLVATINGIFNLVQIIGMFFIAMLVKKYGKRNVFALGLIFDIIGMLILNFGGGIMPVIIVFSIIRGIGNACGGATMWAMVSDTIDYGEWKSHDPDHLKPKYFNPDSVLQKSGHGSYIENELGEVYLVHLTSRPFVPELRCTLGRETAMQKMKWTEDGWLRMADGSNLAKEYFEPSKLTSVHATVTTKMEFKPEVHQHSAGLIMYYDNMNYINLRKYYSETLGQSALSIIHLENGEKTEFLNTRIPVDDVPIYLRLHIDGRKSYFEWSYDGKDYLAIGKVFDTTKFSDEYCKYGEFTGTFVGITCADRVKHQHYADFDFFEYVADETRDVN